MVYYEFKITRERIEQIVNDLSISQSSVSVNIVDNILSLLEDEGCYAKVQLNRKPGLMLTISKAFEKEGLPFPIEGLHVFVHPSSEGTLDLMDFEKWIECSFEKNEIPYKKYKTSVND